MRERRSWFLWMVGFLGLVSLYGAFLFAPRAKWPGPAGTQLGEVQRIFYFHVPIAWVMFFAFFLSFVFSVLYLVQRKRLWDIWAVASVEVGVLFSILAMITGSLWAKPAWGVYWTWDPRLTTILILFLMYVGYLIFRGFVEEESQQARLGAVISILAFANVPLTYISVRLWRSLHPVVFFQNTGEKVAISPPMLTSLLVSILFFTLLTVALIRFRARIEALERTLLDLGGEA